MAQKAKWLRATVRAARGSDGTDNLAAHLLIFTTEDEREFTVVTRSHNAIGVALFQEEFSVEHRHTFELFRYLLELSGGSLVVKCIFIYDIHDDGEFAARILVRLSEGEATVIECNVGDGVNLVLRDNGKILVAERVFECLDFHIKEQRKENRQSILEKLPEDETQH